MNIGERLRQERKERRLSATAISNLLHISCTTLFSKERGASEFRISELIRLCEIMGWDKTTILLEVEW